MKKQQIINQNVTAIKSLQGEVARLSGRNAALEFRLAEFEAASPDDQLVNQPSIPASTDASVSEWKPKRRGVIKADFLKTVG
jgi:hypothetical protein